MKGLFFVILAFFLIQGGVYLTGAKVKTTFAQDRQALVDKAKPKKRFTATDIPGDSRIHIITDTFTGCKYISWWGGRSMTPLYISGGTIDCSGTKRTQTK